MVLSGFTRIPPISGQNPGHSVLWFLNLPGFIGQLVAQAIVPIMWSLHPVALQLTSIASDVLVYSAIAYLILRWASLRKSSVVGPMKAADNPTVRSDGAQAWRTISLA